MRYFIINMVLTLLCYTGYSETVKAQYYQTTSANIKFYSSAPVEDIEAVSREGVSVINSENGKFSFKVKIRSFRFPKALMQEHFNENYMESETYPDATFKGYSQQPVDISKTTIQNLIFKGILEVHGVKQEREIPVSIKMSPDGNTMKLESNFEVKCEDHEIQIPKILWENIAEVIEVSVVAEYKILK